jgi:hypothetical protein
MPTRFVFGRKQFDPRAAAAAVAGGFRRIKLSIQKLLLSLAISRL